MIVVADSSPINILVRLGCVEILPALFGKVIIPPEVRDELLDKRTPGPVYSLVVSHPDWLQVSSPAPSSMLSPLDPGESAAIRLALQMKADVLLIDEKDGRKYARSLGLKIIGTLGVLDRAAEKGIIQLDQVMARLIETDFRVDSALVDSLLAKHRVRMTEEPPD